MLFLNLSYPQGKISDIKSTIIDLLRELFISNMHNKFEQDTYKNNDVQCEKSQLFNHSDFFLSHF